MSGSQSGLGVVAGFSGSRFHVQRHGSAVAALAAPRSAASPLLDLPECTARCALAMLAGHRTRRHKRQVSKLTLLWLLLTVEGQSSGLVLSYAFYGSFNVLVRLYVV